MGKRAFTIPKGDWNEETYTRGTRVWLTIKLIAASEPLETIDLHINSIDMGIDVWSGSLKCMYDFMDHYQRIEDCDINHPVIMDNEGGVINGWHRIVKAWSLGKKTIKAKRFETMPIHDRIEEKDEE